jgi:hypothetical protein
LVNREHVYPVLEAPVLVLALELHGVGRLWLRLTRLPMMSF